MSTQIYPPTFLIPFTIRTIPLERHVLCRADAINILSFQGVHSGSPTPVAWPRSRCCTGSGFTATGASSPQSAVSAQMSRMEKSQKNSDSSSPRASLQSGRLVSPTLTMRGGPRYSEPQFLGSHPLECCCGFGYS